MIKSTILAGLAVALLFGGCGLREKEQEVSPEQNNPLLIEFGTPFGVPPFAEIHPGHYLPAFEKAMAAQLAEIDRLVEQNPAPVFSSLMAPFFNSGARLQQVAAVFYSQVSACGTDELLQIQAKVDPLMAAHQDAILLNEKLFAGISRVYENRRTDNLGTEDLYLLESAYLDFVRNGARLEPQEKQRLTSLNQELASLEAAFQENLLKENRAFQLVIEKEEDLAGLPAGVIAAAVEEAEASGHPGKWIFTTDKPSLLPFLTYAQNRKLRQELFQAYTSRGDRDNRNDNKEILARIFDLRVEKALLLGYENYADYVLEAKMAGRSDTVMEFLDRLWPPALKAAEKEAAALQKLADSEGDSFELAPWDWWYYAEKERLARYALDDSELRPYFKLENVINGVFLVAGRLFGLQFSLPGEIPRPHAEALAYEVREADGSLVGLLYLDLHPRPGKQVGAWCGSYRDTRKLEGKRVLPIITVVGNLTRPGRENPALLSLDEVSTLFHEFGHALDFLLAENSYIYTNIATDFVELPSQIMEHWALEPEVLREYARHHASGTAIPDALIEKIKKSSLFNQGFSNTEYLAACLLDLAYHTRGQAGPLDIRSFEQDLFRKIGLIPQILPRYRSTYFAHIAAWGYSAGYYSYIWSGVLDCDAFAAFEETSLFDPETALSFRRNVLEKNGSADPAELFRAFRGRDARIEYLLKKRGLN